MKCPDCVNTLLIMSERQGVEIDYCPQCRGIWLDRGELDKLLERAAAQTAPQPVAQASHRHERQPDPPHYGHHKHYKHKSWLSEIFD